MFRQDEYDNLQRRRSECEAMSLTAKDVSIRRKFAELAIGYQVLAERMQRFDRLEADLLEPIRLG